MTDESLTGSLADPELAKALALMVARSRRVLFVIVATQGVLLILALIGLGVLGSALIRAEHRIAFDEATTASALCDSQFTIATAPLPPGVSKFALEFVEASRKGFVVLDCPGQIGPPGKALQEAATKYGITLRY